MYAKRIQLTNFGPIEQLDIEFPFHGDVPKPTVLVGQNGSGKSILLAHIVDALLKGKDTVYPETPEVDPGRVYKLKSNFYIRTGSGFSFARVDFEDGWFVTELTTMKAKQEYSGVPAGITGTAAESLWRRLDASSNDHSETNLLDGYEAFRKLQRLFGKNCVQYFPSNRFEEPAWLNQQDLTAPVEYVERKRMPLHTDRRAIAVSPFRDNRNWLFDVIYDRRVPETRSVRVPIPVPPGDKPWIIEAERTEVRDHDNRVLNTALDIVRRVLRDDSNANFRISRRGYRFMALHGDDGLIVPNLTQLSSGEMSLLNLFLSILRDFEAAGASSFSDSADVRGVVIVDEVDLHLHAVHQFEILPQLIGMFPNVQFIMTTHSPLFVLGMERAFGADGFGLYDLPGGHRIKAEEFGEFGDAFRTFSSTRRFVEDIRAAVSEAQRPVLVPEGETDLRYLRKAAEVLGRQATLEGLEIKPGNGRANLAKVWKHPASDLFSQKVLLLFDCDEDRPDGERGNLVVRTIPFQPGNPVQTGIENLFSQQTLDRARLGKPAFIDVEHKHTRLERGQETTIPERWSVNQDEKTSLCDWLCEHGTQDDFRGFEVVFDLVEGALAVPESAGPNAGHGPAVAGPDRGGDARGGSAGLLG